jgi:hypothetical protein
LEGEKIKVLTFSPKKDFWKIMESSYDQILREIITYERTREFSNALNLGGHYLEMGMRYLQENIPGGVIS